MNKNIKQSEILGFCQKNAFMPFMDLEINFIIVKIERRNINSFVLCCLLSFFSCC